MTQESATAAPGTRPPTAKRLADAGGLIDRGLTSWLGALRRGIGQLWQLAGSRQLRNALVALGLVVGAALTLAVVQELRGLRQELQAIAESNRIEAFSAMRMLQAAGLAPSDADMAQAGQATGDPAAIDPAALDRPNAGQEP